MLLRSVERACIGGVQAFEDEDEVELVEAEVDHEDEVELVEATAKVAETVVKMPCLSRNSFRKKRKPKPCPKCKNAVSRTGLSNCRTPCMSRNSFTKKETPNSYPQRANAVFRKDPSNRRANHASK